MQAQEQQNAAVLAQYREASGVKLYLQGDRLLVSHVLLQLCNKLQHNAAQLLFIQTQASQGYLQKGTMPYVRL